MIVVWTRVLAVGEGRGSGYFQDIYLKVQSTEFTDELDVLCKTKRRVKDRKALQGWGFFFFIQCPISATQTVSGTQYIFLESMKRVALICIIPFLNSVNGIQKVKHLQLNEVLQQPQFQHLSIETSSNLFLKFEVDIAISWVPSGQ